ncbi:MAG: hypothetical protein FWG07_09495 [Treponema sp.]|nr:hypothetical protein [Treponema sp.]
MKKKLGVLAILVFCLAVISCDTGSTSIPDGQVFFQSGTSDARNVRSVSGDNVEFLVSNLLLVRDDAPTNGWLIGESPSVNNIGWYDVAGLNRTTVCTPLNNAPHSCIRLSINAIRVNDTIIWHNGAGGWPPGFDYLSQYDRFSLAGIWPPFDIIAGDKSKLGKHEYIGIGGMDNDTPEIPFNGVSGLMQVNEFIIFVDETKLHTNGTIESDWWECFSFSVR